MRHPWKLRAVLGMVAVAAGLPGGLGSGARAAGEIEVLGTIVFTGGTEIAWEGKYVYAGELDGVTGRGQKPNQKGGVHIVDVSGPAPVQISYFKCPGNDTDVVSVSPGLLAVAHHTSACNKTKNNVPANGMYLLDVKDPLKPKQLGGVAVPSAHTLTPYPGKPYIYVHPGGLAVGGGVTSIVDISDPLKPKVAASFTPSVAGCHDLQFMAQGAKVLAFCASGGAGEVQTWDVTNPLAPVIIGRIVNPAIQFPHNAVPSPDGKLLVVNDEAFAAHECATGTSLEGSLWIYDITDPALPVLAGRVAPPASRATVNTAGGTEKWCTAHNYNFVPGTRILTSAWFTGGSTVEDLSNPLLPQRIAHYQPANAVAYTSHFYAGKVFVADMVRGLEVLRVPAITTAAATPAATGPRIDRTPELVPASFQPSAPRARTEAARPPTLFCTLSR